MLLRIIRFEYAVIWYGCGVYAYEYRIGIMVFDMRAKGRRYSRAELDSCMIATRFHIMPLP